MWPCNNKLYRTGPLRAPAAKLERYAALPTACAKT